MAAVLTVDGLRARFLTRRGIVQAVNNVSFSLDAGETLGIVGESGSGKSVSQMSYLRLLPEPPLQIQEGSAKFLGEDILKMSPTRIRQLRGDQVSVIFQEPMTSLNPFLRIGEQVMEPLFVHKKASRKDAQRAAEEAFDRVGISDASRTLQAYPHEFSGGMRQRVMIAMALTTRPKVLIADEPTTALDVTVQAQILQLLKSIQAETGMAILLITHDLGVIAGTAHRVAVMYAGRIMETGTVDDIFYRTKNPYTEALLKSTPRLDRVVEKLPNIPGTPPDLSRLGAGCAFADRCPRVLEICRAIEPPVRKFDTAQTSRCHLEALNS